MGFMDAVKALGSSPKRAPKKPPIVEAMPGVSGHQQLVDYLAENPKHGTWFSAMRSADFGDTSRMQDVFSDALDRDARLRGLNQKRATSMMGRPIVFRPPEGFEGDEVAQQRAKDVRRILLLHSRKFRSMLSHLMSAPLNCYAVSPITWAANGYGEWVPHLRFEHSNRFGYHRETRELGFFKGRFRGGIDVDPLHNYPDQFVVHEPMAGRSDYPWRRGAMRSCIVPSFIKRNGLRYWLVLAERFGMPQVYARVGDVDYDNQSSDTTVGQIRAALSSLGRYWYAVFGKEVEIEKIEGSGEADAEVHKALTEWANTEMAIAILGQNLTTEVSGGSFAASETHRWVADDIHLADAVELAETITQQLIEPIIRYNWPGDPVPVCEITTGRKQVFQTEHYYAGVCNADELRRSLGHDAKPDGTGSAFFPHPITPSPVAGADTGPAPADPDDGNGPGGDGDTKPSTRANGKPRGGFEFL